ncbi:neprilysin-1-like [Ruditapes philippinarum]|uniref:neprilysin-1-like n=1 Tax=Ruditapes philippinarum TaxID=129788 RepID=UPI00295B64A5|nr:neprilysin-1-like [Ruditapes philippinarum]
MDGSYENKGYDNRDVENKDNRATVTKDSQVHLSFKKEGPLERRTKCEKILLFLLVILVIAVIILIIVVAVQKKDLDDAKESKEMTTPKPDATKPDVCFTAECTKASAQLYESLDMSVDPCEDFYAYSCGTWRKKHALPEDKSFYGTTTMLGDGAEMTNKYLLEDTESYKDIEAIVKAKDLYASCMDMQKINEKATSAAVPLLEELGGWPVLGSNPGGNWSESDFSLIKLLVTLNKYNSRRIINLVVSGDLKESNKNILELDQPGFGIPGKVYMVDDSFAHYREAYVILASSMAQLFGADKTIADKEMREMLEFEMDLARIATSPENRTDFAAIYNNMALSEITEIIAETGPADSIQFDLLEFTKEVFDLERVKVANIVINESEPVAIYDLPYYEKVLGVLRKHGKRSVANYAVWMIIKDLASVLDSRFQALLKQYAETLTGTSSSPPRWKDCVATSVGFFPKAVGHMFVKETFDESAKKAALDMIDRIRDAFNQLLNDNDWMDETTKELARDKANAIEEWIGYPEEVLDVDKINKLYENDTINRDEYFQNVLSKLKKTSSDNLKTLRLPVDKNTWKGSPSTINAFYSPQLNKILFPAGILQPPAYAKGQPRSMNYGSIGSIMGHEITHGFDNQGRQFDKYGNVKQWWNTSIIESFNKKAQCFVDQYNNFLVKEAGFNVNGMQTLGENIADNGGIKQSFKAYRKWVEQHGSEEPMLPGLNFTHNQLFFINFAQFFCENGRKEGFIIQLNSGVHSPNEFRVIGTLQNSQDFSDVFGCKKNSRMNPEKKCYVW